MDLGAVQDAPTLVLAKGTMAAARNAQELLHDARVLAEAGSRARAYSLAVLAVEEAGKAGNLALLTAMPEALRAQAPVGRMLEWHQLKQVCGLLIGKVPVPVASSLAVMPAGEVERILTTLDMPADEADRLKRHGLYVDVDRGAGIREPSEITESMVIAQLARAGQAISASAQWLKVESPAQLVNPYAELAEFAQATVSAVTEARYARTPRAAVDVHLNAVSKFRDRIAAN